MTKEELNPVQIEGGVIVKGWRKRDAPDLEERLKKWGMKPDD